jgi:hypothetical protein
MSRRHRGIIGLTLFVVLVSACGRASPTATSVPAPSPTTDERAPSPLDVAWDDRTLFREGLIG